MDLVKDKNPEILRLPETWSTKEDTIMLRNYNEWRKGTEDGRVRGVMIIVLSCVQIMMMEYQQGKEGTEILKVRRKSVIKSRG